MYAEFVVARVESDWFWVDDGHCVLDATAKLTGYYWHTVDQPERTHIITRDKSYHGAHSFGTGMAHIEGNRVGFDELAPGGSRAACGSVADLDDESERSGARNVAAFFCDPTIGATAVYPPPPTCLPEVGGVRGATDLQAAIEIAPGILERRPGADTELHRAVRDTGVLVRPLGSAVVVSPQSRSRTESRRSLPEPLLGLDHVTRT